MTPRYYLTIAGIEVEVTADEFYKHAGEYARQCNTFQFEKYNPRISGRKVEA